MKSIESSLTGDIAREGGGGRGEWGETRRGRRDKGGVHGTFLMRL